MFLYSQHFNRYVVFNEMEKILQSSVTAEILYAGYGSNDDFRLLKKLLLLL